MVDDKQPLSELLRPQRLEDLTLPQPVINRLQRMIETKQIINMVFDGRPGLGKTSTARLMIKAIGPKDLYEIGGMSLTSAEGVRNKLEGYVSSVSMFGGEKICFIDEADTMGKGADAALRPLIERAYGHCAFILATNNMHKLSEGVRSRLLPISFDIPGTQRDAVIQRWRPRYEEKLSALAIKYDPRRLEEIIGIYFPDLRQIAELIEFEFCCDRFRGNKSREG